jgi:hypothetical protein
VRIESLAAVEEDIAGDDDAVDVVLVLVLVLVVVVVRLEDDEDNELDVSEETEDNASDELRCACFAREMIVFIIGKRSSCKRETSVERRWKRGILPA